MRAGGRRQPRCPVWDYTSPGAYYITLVTHHRQEIFAHATGVAKRLTRRGILATACWLAIPSHFPQVRLDEFVIRPNHIARRPRRSRLSLRHSTTPIMEGLDLRGMLVLVAVVAVHHEVIQRAFRVPGQAAGIGPTRRRDAGCRVEHAVPGCVVGRAHLSGRKS